MISAKIVEDSYYEIYGRRPRLTTFVLSYPRWIHAELMTHRKFSRCAASSRAIPISKMIARATKQTAFPVVWGSNQKGMQAGPPLTGWKLKTAETAWIVAAYTASFFAWGLSKLGVHKQIANRLIENFQNIEVVVTSSSWANFFALRNHPDAQPEIQTLASKMLEAYRASSPKALQPYDWHLPFVTEAERATLPVDVAPKVSAARCARVSYLNHEGRTPTLAEDLALFERLMGSTPKHASPTEHQAYRFDAEDWESGPLSLTDHNLGVYWVQFRKTIKDENINVYQEIKDC
jgi:hypothetical protein